MTATVEHLTTRRVADGKAEALAWLARQRAWERRLAELERPWLERAPRERPVLPDLARTA